MSSSDHSKDKHVLLTFRGSPNDTRDGLVQEMMSTVGPYGSVSVRNFDENLEGRKYNLVTCGELDSEKQVISEDKAIQLSKLLVPNGKLRIKKSGKEDCTIQNTISNLKLSGFVNISESSDVLEAEMPSYESGSKVQLSFAASSASTAPSSEQKVWQLNGEEDDEEMIDDNELLDDEDLKKPDPESLRVCGTTGKRKACANCSCGLAEEIESEALKQIKDNTQNAKSSCGSCYLGDAFRCAACPYLGMPAFKPGEKVLLDSNDDL